MSPTMDLPDLTDGQKEWLRMYDILERNEREAIMQMSNAFISNRSRS